MTNALQISKRPRHGHCGKSGRTRTFRSWESMRDRCSNNNCDQYPRYGGRGIRVCERWSSFEAFLADMGERPDGCTLERKDKDGNYEPDNCCWANAKDQARNRSNNTSVTHLGRTQAVSAWCEELGINYPATIWRLKKGWSVDRALTTPFRKMKAYRK